MCVCVCLYAAVHSDSQATSSCHSSPPLFFLKKKHLFPKIYPPQLQVTSPKLVVSFLPFLFYRFRFHTRLICQRKKERKIHPHLSVYIAMSVCTLHRTACFSGKNPDPDFLFLVSIRKILVSGLGLGVCEGKSAGEYA